MDALLASPAGNAGNNGDIAVGNSNNVFVSMVPQSGAGAYSGVFRSGNGGSTWISTPGMRIKTEQADSAPCTTC